MATEILDPSSDGATTEWTPSSGSDHYAMIDDAVREPGDPGTGTAIFADPGSGAIDEIGFSTGTFTSISNAEVWVYANDDAPIPPTMNVYISFDGGSSYTAPQNIDATTTPAWHNLNFTVTETDSSQVMIKFEVTGGTLGAITMFEAYVILTGSADPSGYANKVNGIIGAKINGILVANITKVNGI